MRGMSLFTRRLLVCFQYLVNELFDRSELWTPALGPLPLRRQRVLNRLPHHPSVHSELLGHSDDRSAAMLILPPQLLE
jgi:hypothetical protein